MPLDHCLACYFILPAARLGRLALVMADVRRSARVLQLQMNVSAPIHPVGQINAVGRLSVGD